MKIGACVESTGLPFRQALPALARAGAQGVQFDAAGELAADRLTDTGRRELRNLFRTYALTPVALNVPLRRASTPPRTSSSGSTTSPRR